MSKFKKTKKSKDETFVSQPLNLRHVTHLGPLDVTSSGAVCGEEAGNEPPTPCQGTEGNLEAKTVQKLIQSSDFQQYLRTIIREEASKAIKDGLDVLLKEIETLLHPPPPRPCSTPGTLEDNSSMGDTLGTNKDGRDDANTTDNQSTPLTISVKEVADDQSVSTRFENPLYIAQHSIRKLKPCPAPRPSRLQDRQDSDETSQTELKKVARRQFGPRSALSRDDERECLSQALQTNIVDLVDRLQFNYSALPDQLISAGHMTEDECRMLRNDIRSRKDQVRYLISRTKCRDLKDIQRFLQLIEPEVPDVVTKIREKFDENKRNNVKCTTCALCQCTNNVDIKDIVDILWSMRAVSDGFYNEVIACPKPRGSQELLWKSLVDICNSKQNKEKRKTYAMLFDFMGKKGNFDFIVKPLQRMLEKDGRLECHCHSTFKSSSERSSFGVLSSCSPRSSCSMSESRQSTFSGEFNREIVEQVGEQVRRKSEGFVGRKLERQERIEDHRPELTTSRQSLSHATSLDMLETIQEETGKSQYRKGIDYVSQTVEFHGPVSPEYANFSIHEHLHSTADVTDFRRQFKDISGFEQNRSSEA